MSDDTPSTDERTAADVMADMRDVIKYERPDDTVRVPVSDLVLLLNHIESVRAEERERIARLIEAHAATDYQTRRLAYENAARIAREGA